MEAEKATAIIEAALFMESESASEKYLSRITGLDEDVVHQCIEYLSQHLSDPSCGVELKMITGGWALVPKTEVWQVLREHYGSKSAGRLSRSARDTLSIIAYSQPITRAEIESLRGVNCDAMIHLLIERGLVKEVGKKDVPGRPVQFGTTKEFLKYFHLNSIADLPRLDEDESERFELAR